SYSETVGGMFFFSGRRRHTRFSRDWSSDVCSSDLPPAHRQRPGAAGPCRDARRAFVRSRPVRRGSVAPEAGGNGLDPGRRGAGKIGRASGREGGGDPEAEAGANRKVGGRVRIDDTG